MEAIDLLLNRYSASRLIQPAPSGETLHKIIQAGMRVPDHGALRPWRFIIIENAGLTRFSQLLVATAQQLAMGEEAVEKARLAPLRAPMIIAVVAHCTPSNNVPYQEQRLSAGCAVMAMQMAAFALGFNGIWRSGVWTEAEQVRQAFGCRVQDTIVGFLYLGTAKIRQQPMRQPVDPAAFIRYF